LKNLNCHSVQLTYSDNSFLKISNTDKETNLYFSKEGKETTKKLRSGTGEDIKNEESILSRIEDFIPFLERIENEKWLDPITNKSYDTKEIILNFSEHFPIPFFRKIKSITLASWDPIILPGIKTDFLNTRRLDYVKTTIKRHPRYRDPRYSEEQNTNPLISLSKKISDKIKKSSEDYSKISQNLDSLFVSEVLKAAKHKESYEKPELIKKLNNLNEKAKNLHNAGIIDEQSNLSLILADLEAITGTKLMPVFEKHIENTEEKLKVFDDVYEQVNLITSIINERFRFKEIKISKDNGIEAFDKDNGKKISLDSLSSGEQHELYLFSSLIFNDSPADILFIDEPEISLHIEWQTSFVNDLLKIKKLEKTQIIIATHSPAILGDHFDRAFDLVEMNNADK
jgi:ABC-type lipoprotein export system ATPase subunit